jgi:glycosyltransferase involved in cell wall biosynthesis
MKLAIITRYFPKDYFGGGESVVYNVWKRAIDIYDVSLISGWVKDPALLPERAYSFDLRSKNRFVRYLKLYFNSKKFVKQIKPDVIHTNTMEIPNFNIPTVVMVHHIGHLIGSMGKVKLMAKFQKYLVKRKLNKVKQIVTVSNATKNDLIKIGVNPGKIKVIYNGIDVDKFKPKKVNNEKFTIVYPSRISREKGQHLAIKAIKELSEEHKKRIKLIIAGYVSDKSYLDELKYMAKGLPIEIKTNVAKIEEEYMNSDLVIFPTLMFEGFGLVAAEAMCCEKPVIATDVPAVREVVREDGILIKLGDHKALSNAIIKLYNNPNLREKFGRDGRKFVLKNFTWNIAFKKYKEVYEKLISD